jgi:hypothetical protein
LEWELREGRRRCAALVLGTLNELVGFALFTLSKGNEKGVVVIRPDHWRIIATPIILGRRRFSLKEPGELEALAQYFTPSDSPYILSSPSQLPANVAHGIFLACLGERN